MNKGIASCSLIGVLAGCVFLHGCPGALGPTGGEGLSDVPCFTPTEWSEDIIDFTFRSEVSGSDVLLFTAQTLEQGLTDVDDGSLDIIPHESVYRFDPASDDFVRVDDSQWDTADGKICDGCPDFEDEGPFVIEDGKLRFNGRNIPVAGRVAVDIFDARLSTCVEFDAPTANAIAVLSVDGNVGLLGDTTGQHYHQLFSKGDGSQLGETLLLGLEGGSVNGCWTADEKYVLHHFGTQEIPIAGRICVVPVAEALAEHGSR